MEQNVGRKGGLKKWVLAVVVLVALGAGGYYGFSNGYLQPLIDSLGNPKLETARGVIRDLRRMDLPDGKHFNIFLLEAETGELIPLCLDYDNHGLKDGDRIEAYDTHRRYYTLLIRRRMPPRISLSLECCARLPFAKTAMPRPRPKKNNLIRPAPCVWRFCFWCYALGSLPTFQ